MVRYINLNPCYSCNEKTRAIGSCSLAETDRLLGDCPYWLRIASAMKLPPRALGLRFQVMLRKVRSACHLQRLILI